MYFNGNILFEIELCQTDTVILANVFVTSIFLVTDIIMLSDSIFWLNKLGVNVGIILFYF